jgi:preprotein translocase SecF subunit
MRIIKNTNIDFLGKTNITTIFSVLLILLGTISIILNGGPKLSIDFKGGTLIAVNYTDTVNIEKIREELSSISIDGQNFNFSNAEIKYFGDKSNIAVRIASMENEPEQFTKKFTSKMADIFPNSVPQDMKNFVLSIEKVGPKVGAELSSDALMAILSALFFILIYVSVRFEFKYALGAIAALTHDVLITLGVFSLLGYEVSLAVIAAFLTIVGYSLNDTIVIFDRVRENVKISKNANIISTINKSINESLSRTIITSITTFFVVLILFIFGGEVIHTFSFAMIIGVLIGTYSSIFVASPVVVYMDSK